MILKRFYDEELAQASYLIGCAATGEALVVDAGREPGPYLRAAEAEGVRVTHVTETHIHADFVSGSRELARQSGARLFLSGEGGEEWQYGFAEEDGAVLLRHGDRFAVGNVVIDVLHTPGHTPEHLTFLVTDTAAADEPIGALTGDFVFVGDVGRPDLLERAAGVAGSKEAGARALFRSLRAFREQPDWLQIWPGHGAGSACGKGLSSVPHSTVGYERRFSWAWAVDDEDAFVAAVLAGQPEPPRYFARMKRINRDGPPLLGGPVEPPRLDGERLGAVLAGGATVLDARPAEAFARGHLPGTLSIPLNRSFSTWAGSLLPYDRELYLIADPDAARAAARALSRIGIDGVAGYFEPEAVETRTATGELARVPQMEVEELAAARGAGGPAVLDVRGRAEWEAGHLPGVANVPLPELESRLAEVPRDRPLVLHCQGGARSMIAAALLRARGYDNVVNLRGGYAAWRAAGHPTEGGAAPAS